MNQELSRKIDAWLNEHRDEMVADICTLSRSPSVRSEPQPGAPYGKACRDALDVGCEVAAKNGFEAKIYSDRYALMHYGDGEKSIGIFGHLDVVPEGNDWLYTKPFEPIEYKGYLIGRGVSDNKGGVIAGLYAIRALKELGVPIKSRLTLFMGSDEETGMDDVITFTKEQKMPDFSLVPDTEFPVCHGEKGIFKTYAAFKEKSEALLSFGGGQAINVVCDNVVATLKAEPALAEELAALCADNEWVDCAVEGDVITVKARGIASHASTPDASHNATWEMAKLLSKAKNLPAGDRRAMEKLAVVLADSYGEAIGVAAADERSGRLTCANGIAKMIDGCVAVSFDVRYCVSLDGSEVEAGFKRCFEEDGWNLIGTTYSNGYHIPIEDDRIQTLARVYREESGDDKAKPYTMGGGTYARRLKNAVAFGAESPYSTKSRPEGMIANHGGAHQPDEVLDLAYLPTGIKIFISALIELDAILNA
ncbi:MAG: Sapep family Mn(2+)-dependent dipeptidase [Clostridia bacterium]|nr:Sapep family Mn(2+)-dependent dipeptidase [Clostridia bacterium]MBQ5999972.1 Sapep family Mn(2+)-dependent dipeptidase [Clostridia bacterium]